MQGLTQTSAFHAAQDTETTQCIKAYDNDDIPWWFLRCIIIGSTAVYDFSFMLQYLQINLISHEVYMKNILNEYLFCSVKDSSTVTPVTLRVDPQGYFLYWTDQNKVRFLF